MRRTGPAARRLAADLRDTAAAYPRTVGLAAPQIGVMQRMVFIDCTGHPKVPDPLGPTWLIDPVVTRAEGSEVGREGCLSLPDITANVRRATSIALTATDLEGRELSVELEGFEARVALHEIDHLDGILILDRVSSIADDVFRRKARRGSRARP